MDRDTMIEQLKAQLTNYLYELDDEEIMTEWKEVFGDLIEDDLEDGDFENHKHDNDGAINDEEE